MGLLTKLKSLLGFEDDRSQVRRGESGVTIEREPDESAEPDAETESAVKGVDAGEGESFDDEGTAATDESAAGDTETGVSTEDVTTTPEGDQSVETERDEVAESAEADDTGADAAEPGQTAADEPEPTPEDAGESETGAGTDAVEGIEEVEEAEEPEAAETVEATEPAGESAAAGEPLEDVKGIGPAYAERLRDAGVADVAELAEADADRLAGETNLSAKRISSWIDRAKAR